ncbi:MAG: hypothetical protein ACTSSI_17245 [Candidatus Helarchaeota archaeon]
MKNLQKNRKSRKEIETKIRYTTRKFIKQLTDIEDRINAKIDELCPFILICNYCENYPSFKCCFIRRIENGNDSSICKNRNCISQKECEKIFNEGISVNDVPRARDILKSDYKVTNPLNDFMLPYYPKLEFGSEEKIRSQINLLNELKIPGFLVSLNDIFSPKNENFIQEKYRDDLHRIFSFEGEIILSTNIRDSYCELLLSQIDKVPEMISMLNPDAFTTLDANFYLDQPFFITAIQLSKILKANRNLSRLKIRKIGLVPPSMPPFFQIGLFAQINRGFNAIAIPLLELNKYNSKIHNLYKKNIIAETLRIQSKIDFKYILLSTSPNNTFLSGSYSSKSWLLSTQRNKKKRLMKYNQIAKQIRKQKIINEFIN